MDATRPDPVAAFRLAPLLRALQEVTPIDIACGGTLVEGDDAGFVVDELLGTRTEPIRDLAVDRGHGVGGKALLLGRPVHVRSYHDARGITHRYDDAVRRARLRSMFAVPVCVPGGPRAVVYGAMRGEVLIGDRIIGAAVGAVRSFERDAAVQVEVRRRLREALGSEPASTPSIREIYADLAHIAASVPDEPSRLLVHGLMRRLAAPERDTPPEERPVLTRRETDVLAQVAVGCTNELAAERLGVLPSTVKGYLKSASRKLGARNRVQAVTTARRWGVIP